MLCIDIPLFPRHVVFVRRVSMMVNHAHTTSRDRGINIRWHFQFFKSLVSSGDSFFWRCHVGARWRKGIEYLS